MRIAALLAATVALALTGCGGGQSDPRPGTGAASRGGTLTLGAPSAPSGLDPARGSADPSGVWFPRLAYDALLELGPDGEIHGGLAKTWGYVGEGNRVFELTLRPGITFSDGSPVDAAAAVASIDRWRASPWGALWAAEIAKVEVTGPLSLRITCDRSNPELARLLTWQYLGGTVVNPKALARPEQLATMTFGSGPYTLDPARTVAGDHYTYVPNPRYRDRDAQAHSKVVIRVYTDQKAALSALRSGQVDLVTGATPATARAARAARLGVEAVPSAFAGVNLLDRHGHVQPALADVRVRRALNLAINRRELAEGLFSGYAQPTSQIGAPNSGPWFDPELDDYWAYDPRRARQLLADAGYADGFSVQLVTPVFGGTNLVAQAVGGYWKEVGVDVKVKPAVGPQAVDEAVASKTFAASGFIFGATPMFLMAKSWFAPVASRFNAWATSDPKIDSLLARAAKASGDEQSRLYRAVQRRGLELAWFAPVARIDTIYLFRPDAIEDVEIGPGQQFVDPRAL